MNDSIEPREGFVNTSDGQLHYLAYDSHSLQAHFLHGNGFCAGTYTPFLKFLLKKISIVASDVRGHGESIRLDHRRIRHWDIFAEDLKVLVEKAMIPPIIGMGHSLGAVSTYIAASKFPHLFSCIILIDPSILPRRTLWAVAFLKILGLRGNIPLAKAARRRRKRFNGKKEALIRFTSGRGIFKSWSKDFVEAYLECGLLEKDSETAVLRCDPELEAQIFESVPFNVWTFGKRITCPVLVVRGEQSDVFLEESSLRLKRTITDSEFVTIPNSGHFIPMEKPKECAEVILEFIARRELG